MQIGTKKQYIRVGFILNFNDGWVGGINYYNNLFKMIYTYGTGLIRIIVFANKKTANILRKEHGDKIEVVTDDIFERKTIRWFLSRVMHKFLNCDYLLNNLIIANNIELMSHLGEAIYNSKIKTLTWIPDFQHIHLPQLFSEEELASRNMAFSSLINCCDGLLLSSYDAANDSKFFREKYRIVGKKEYVLQFAVADLELNKIISLEKIVEQFEVESEYFFLPNQFWQHKNHKVVLEALLEIKKNNHENKILILATGNTTDYRNLEHFNELEKFIKTNKLESMFKILGSVNYQEVISLMYHSRAVINPSFFEGWSTTVEEAKMLNKIVILSNIAVHKEQNPINGIFFDPRDAKELANILMRLNKNDCKLEKYDYNKQQRQVAYDYENIVLDITQNK